MKRFLLSLLAVVTLAGCAENLTPIDYVDPMIGTGFHAHTYPGATTPYGMVQLSPDTRVGGWDACSGYHYSDNTILGFSHTHLSGTGCADLSDILFYPTVKAVNAVDGAYECPAHIFSHKDEVAKPGYYSVEMDNKAIKAELTATPRTGVHRYTFNAGDVRAIVIDLKHTVAAPDEIFKGSQFKVISDTEIQGYKNTDAFVPDQHQYFFAVCDCRGSRSNFQFYFFYAFAVYGRNGKCITHHNRYGLAAFWEGSIFFQYKSSQSIGFAFVFFPHFFLFCIYVQYTIKIYKSCTSFKCKMIFVVACISVATFCVKFI